MFVLSLLGFAALIRRQQKNITSGFLLVSK